MHTLSQIRTYVNTHQTVIFRSPLDIVISDTIQLECFSIIDGVTVFVVSLIGRLHPDQKDC